MARAAFLINPKLSLNFKIFFMVDNLSITVLKELRDFIVPLTKEEFSSLEQNILTEGCRDSLVVWEKANNKLFLIDGHNRLKICQRHDLPYKIKKVNFSNIEDAKRWMVDNQMGRRNLNPDQLSYYRGMKYLSLKKNKGGYNKFLSKGQNALLTSEILAVQFKVSESTIKRDSRFAQGLEIIGKSNPQLKFKILSGESKVKKADVQILTQSESAYKLTFKNEADLYNKAKRIRNDILEEIEAKVMDIQNKKVKDAQTTLAQKDPLFLRRDDRLRKIKGMIVSAINKAIKDRNVNSIKELKKLIERLEEELNIEV